LALLRLYERERQRVKEDIEKATRGPRHKANTETRDTKKRLKLRARMVIINDEELR